MPMTPSRIENTMPPISTASAQDQRRLEHREKALDRHLHFAVVDVGDAVEHLLQPARSPRRPGSSASRAADRDRSRRAGGRSPCLRAARAITPSSARASTLLVIVSLTIASPASSVTPLREQRGERAREARDLDLGEQIAEQRQRAAGARPSASAPSGFCRRRRNQHTSEHDDDQHRPPPVLAQRTCRRR